MSDKNLTELEWKKFSKGRNLKDAALVKALADLERAAKSGPDAELAALADIEKQAEVLRKAGKGDKELGAYLDGLDKALDKQRKLSTAQAKKAAAPAPSEGEDEDSPALLTSKMVPLIRQVKKGEQMHALLANTGKEVAVMLARRAISPARRKLMTDYLDGATAKFFPGICIWEENAYTFVLQTQAGGLAKKVRAALLKQVELRLKVRVRGEDPSDVDDDGEPAEQEGEGAGNQAANAPSPAQAGTIPDAPPQPPDPLKAQYDTRMATLEPRVLAALKAQAGDVSKIRAVAEFVRGKAQLNEYKAALAGMDSLEKLLPGAAPQPAGDEAGAFNARLAALLPRVKTALAAGGPDDIKLKVSEAGVFARKKDFAQARALLDEAERLMAASGGGGEPAAAPVAPEGQSAKAVSQVAFTQSRLAWDQVRKFVQGELRKLESAILAESTEEEDYDAIQAGSKQLYEVLDVLDERLIDKLDEALNAEGDQRRALHGEAREIIDEYLDYVNSEPLMQDIDDSGFVDLQIRSTLTTRLQKMAADLGASFDRY
ncbi:hypothetical protein [Pseudorhodoferax sp. Leaf274]|uniref:hypothetical protein n=1 Tax=Pseudorhodoferax sp. Leaf274 TaxID=1736318 RepID=UPI000703ABE0|nr:hypothetical protein [Pseudorhodoferax sp. Leaf274]KQP35420.1 hypothetical protein ASF44_18930 [Pseudorhodoferax sp. Leaf274]